jgi:iron complex outermembrane receptor protein
MSPTFRAGLGASLIALAIVPTAAAADEAPETIIVTARGTDEAARLAVEATPGGVDVVTADDFRDRLAVSLRDTLAFTPGVYTQPRFGQEVRLSIRGSGLSRGFHMRGLTLLQDGIPINLADDNGDFQELDPQVFGRIEVYRGANALRHGGSTLGGAINAVTPTGRTAPGLELRLDGGSFDTVRGKAALAYADPRGDAYLALTGDRSDGDRQHASRSALRFNGNVGVQLTETVETRVYASINHIEQDLPGALTRGQALTNPRLSLPANVANDQERDIDSIRVQNRTTIDLGSGTLATGLFLNAKQLFHPIFQVIDQKSVDRGAFARLDLDRLGDLPVELTLGATARFGDVDAKNFVNVAGRRGARVSDADQSAHTLNAYGELRVKPIAVLTLVAGGVLADGKREIENFTAPARGGAAHFTAFSPKLGLFYAPVDTIRLFANVSRSVELPGFSELSQTPFSVGGTVPPGFVDLDPQRAWTVEAGGRGTAGIAAFELSVYRATIKGELLQFDQGVGVPAATFNADRTLHQGIEAGLELSLGDWARLRQVYTYSDFRFRDDVRYGDNRLPVVPRHAYRGELRLGSDAVHVTPSVEWVPQGAYADYRNTTRPPGYALLGLTAAAEVMPGISLFADARNLTGRRAIGDISAVTTATAASAIYYPVERRAFYAGVRATF